MRQQLGRQSNAAFGAAAFDNLLSCFGSHAGAEAVGAGSLQVTGLKCAFHVNHLPAQGQRMGQKIGSQDYVRVPGVSTTNITVRELFGAGLWTVSRVDFLAA